ncbi:hypothetical protein EP331_00405 [bacterium]|nr:MAG: hypothetical protein EP331_00405 [bacterium]
MTIKERKEHLESVISNAQLELIELREKCPHKNKIEGNYSYRVGQIDLATICDDCGSLIVNHGVAFESELVSKGSFNLIQKKGM